MEVLLCVCLCTCIGPSVCPCVVCSPACLHAFAHLSACLHGHMAPPAYFCYCFSLFQLCRWEQKYPRGAAVCVCPNLSLEGDVSLRASVSVSLPVSLSASLSESPSVSSGVPASLSPILSLRREQTSLWSCFSGLPLARSHVGRASHCVADGGRPSDACCSASPGPPPRSLSAAPATPRLQLEWRKGRFTPAPVHRARCSSLALRG